MKRLLVRLAVECRQGLLLYPRPFFLSKTSRGEPLALASTGLSWGKEDR